MLYDHILVTGANGLLGQTLTKRLSASTDYEVTATARDEQLRFEAACEYTAVDVTAPDEIRQAFEDVDPDVVVNCAAVSDVNVHLSSDFVFNGNRGPYDENGRPDPVNYYGRTKLASENILREFDFLDWTIVRPSGLSEETGTENYRADVGYSDPESSTTTRDDLAEFIVEELDSEQFLREGVAVVTV